MFIIKLKGYKDQQYIRQKSIADEESADLKRIKKVSLVKLLWNFEILLIIKFYKLTGSKVFNHEFKMDKMIKIKINLIQFVQRLAVS